MIAGDSTTLGLENHTTFAITIALLVATSVACNRSRSDLNSTPEPQARPMFSEVAEERDLIFQHDAGPTGDYLFPQIMGGGCALFDFDGDGDLDAYLVNGGNLPLSATPGQATTGSQPTRATNRLLRQEDDGQFHDVSAESGLDDPGYGMGVAVGDVDNDGDLDV
jgi:hypothetical protein